MLSLPSRKKISQGLLLFFTIFILFHLCVVLGLIPYHIVWGGRLKDAQQMYVFETVSILINLLMLSVVAAHAGLLRLKMNKKVIRGMLWGMAALFMLNTIGNVFSTDTLERTIFTPITFILSLMCLYLVAGKNSGGSLT